MDSESSGPVRVMWTRGEGCRELAVLLGNGEPARAQGDVEAACVEARADLLVSRRLPSSFDLIDQAAPVDVDLSQVGSVVAAVAGGPHSLLAAQVAAKIGQELGVAAEMVSAYPLEEDPARAVSAVEELFPDVPDIGYRTLPVADMSDLIANFDERALLVFGAPGGSWFQRQFFGPGARLKSAAPAGAVMVRSAPRRVFQEMGEPVFVAPLLHARDTLEIRPEATLAVADQGRLVGLVKRARLRELSGDTPVGEVMEEPLSLGQEEALEAAIPLTPVFGPDPIPVIDHEENLVGGLVGPPDASAA